jgi:hypothetical protein
VIGEGNTKISLYHSSYVHYEPIVTLTKKEQTMLRNRKYWQSAKSSEKVKQKDRQSKRKRAAEKEKDFEGKKKPKKK